MLDSAQLAQYERRTALSPSHQSTDCQASCLFLSFRDIDGFLATLDQGKEAVTARRQALWDKHDPVSADFYEKSMGFGNDGPLIDNMAKVILEQGNYVVGVMGTSVTAGHDNL